MPTQLSSKEIDAVEDTADPSEEESESEGNDLDEETEHLSFFLVRSQRLSSPLKNTTRL